MYILRSEVKQHVSALYDHHQVFFFFLKVPLYKLRCGDLPSDYNSIMPIYRRVLYYNNIYIYFLSLLVGGVFMKPPYQQREKIYIYYCNIIPVYI